MTEIFDLLLHLVNISYSFAVRTCSRLIGCRFLRAGGDDGAGEVELCLLEAA